MATEQQQLTTRFAGELAQVDLPDTTAQLQTVARQLADYTLLLRDNSRALGLISAADSGDLDRLVRRHIVDSIAPVALLAAAGPALRIADLGSGAGLPGVPLALLGREVIAGVLFVERRAKRARFLEQVVAQFDLPASVHDRDLRELVPSDPIDAVVFRAFRRVDRELLKRLRAVFGPAVPVWAYKGKLVRAREEAETLRELGITAQVMPLAVPGLDEERCLLHFTT